MPRQPRGPPPFDVDQGTADDSAAEFKRLCRIDPRRDRLVQLAAWSGAVAEYMEQVMGVASWASRALDTLPDRPGVRWPSQAAVPRRLSPEIAVGQIDECYSMIDERVRDLRGALEALAGRQRAFEVAFGMPGYDPVVAGRPPGIAHALELGRAATRREPKRPRDQPESAYVLTLHLLWGASDRAPLTASLVALAAKAWGMGSTKKGALRRWGDRLAWARAQPFDPRDRSSATPSSIELWNACQSPPPRMNRAGPVTVAELVAFLLDEERS